MHASEETVFDNRPYFVRRGWANVNVELSWAQFFKQFPCAWRKVEWMSVVYGVRKCASFYATKNEVIELSGLLRKFDIRTEVSSGAFRSRGGRNVLCYRVSIGRKSHIRNLLNAWRCGCDLDAGELFGYPSCCCKFYSDIIKLKQLSDAIWVKADNTPDKQQIKPYKISLINLKPELNPIFRSQGVQLLPHHSCSLGCEYSLTFSRKLVDIFKYTSDGDIVDKAIQLMSWPVEWSTLHGISETLCPIQKISSKSDYYDEKRTIRLIADKYPDEGAKPLREMLMASERE